MPNSLDINQLPFDKDMQAALIGHVFTNVSFGQNAVFHIDYKWFNNPNHQQLFKIIKDFWEENKAIPTVQEVSSSPKINAMEIREMNAVRGELTNCREVAKVIRLEVITKDLDSWITARKYIIGIQHFTDKYNSGRLKEAIGDINSTIDDAKRVSFNGVQGVSFLNPVDYLEKKKLSYQNALSTGLRNLDDALAQDGDSRGGGSLYVGDMTVLLAPTNSGKCLGKDTPVMMADGSIKKVQEIQAGEVLMGPDGKGRKVLSTTRGVGPLYKITPKSGGDSWVCNDVHILSLKAGRKEYRYDPEKIVNIPINEYVNKTENFKKIMRLWRVPVDFKERNLPIDPYILGLWLGDGNSKNAAVTSMDSEIIDVWKNWVIECGDNVSVYSQKNNKSSTYSAVAKQRKARVHSNKKFRHLGLLGNKHIPFEYLTSSRAQRLSLLAGIIDTDGYFDGRTTYSIMSKIEKLANDYAYLARSLGFKATVRKKTKTIKKINFSGEYFEVLIRGNLGEVPIRLKRKKYNFRKISKYNREIKNPLLTGFNVEPIGNGEYFGFTLDGDRLFLLGDFTVTHNTTVMSTIAVHNAVHGKDVLFMAHEGNKDDLRINLLRCAMGGETMANLMEISQTDQGARKLNLVSQALEKHLKYIFFVKPGMTVEEVMRIIAMAQEERIAKTGKGFDLLVSDYPAKLLTEIGKRGNLPVRSMYDIIYNQYTQAAGYYNFHVLTAMQTNREGSKANKNEDRLIQSEDVAEAWGIITTATNVITIKRSKKDEKANLITYYVAKSRSNRTGKAILCRSRFEGFKAHDERYENFAYWGDASMTDDERIEQLLKTFKGQTITDTSSASGLIATPD